MNRTSLAQQAETSSFLPPAQSILQRKCACGNKTIGGEECANCAKKKSGMQRKLAIGASNDPLEREADRVADQILAMPTNSTIVRTPPRIQRLVGQPAGQMDTAPASVDRVLASSGRPLKPALRQNMEQRFGHDFSQVRVHSSAAAEQSARDVSAHAYTAGHNVVFGAGQFTPESQQGRRLLAHELTHVVQQGGGKNQRIQRHTLENDPATAPSMTCDIATTSPAGVSLDVTFNKSEDILSAADKAGISNFVSNWHAAAVAEPVRVDGFASIDGLPGSNWPLSCRRAEALARELITPSDGSSGVPASNISLFAQGETEQFSSALEPNRKAQAHIPSNSTPPPFTPDPPAPAFRCGPDVSTQVQAAVAKLISSWGSWSSSKRDDQCDALDSRRLAKVAWDIVDLHNQAWILGYQPACATAGASPPCHRSVEVDSNCYYAGSANYVIFGTMCKLCHAHLGWNWHTPVLGWLNGFPEWYMQYLITLYKGGVLPTQTRSPNFGPSLLWATAGYRGWPSGGTPPKGDRPGCATGCPTPYGGVSFDVNWHPHGIL